MRAIKIDIDGTVAAFEGDEDFWMDEKIVWAEGPYGRLKDHVVYYDDEALFSDKQVRTSIAGRDYPLPCWIVGVDGEDTTDATLSTEKVAADLGPRHLALSDK